MKVKSPERFIFEIAKFADEITDSARLIALEYFRRNNTAQYKNDGSPVTEADKKIETFIRGEIAKKYPDHGIIGEEFGVDNSNAEFTWIIDPIDGTRSFIAGKPTFGTIVGVLYYGKPVVGLIDQAFTQEKWLGISGVGTTYNGIPVSVRRTKDLGDVRLITANPEMFDNGLSKEFSRLRDSVDFALYSCDCYAYGLLAKGDIDLVVEVGLQDHDLYGLIPVIEGAGGFVSNLSGRPINERFDGSIVAAGEEAVAMKAISILTKN